MVERGKGEKTSIYVELKMSNDWRENMWLSRQNEKWMDIAYRSYTEKEPPE